MLLLDSEGLFSTERSDPKYDRRLAAFCVANSNFLMINIKGELSTDVQDVLETVVFMLGKIPTLNTLNKKPRFHFILRDQNDAVSSQMKDSFDKLRAKLEASARAAGCRGGLDDIICLPKDTDEAIEIFSCAVQPQSITNIPDYKPVQYTLLFREGCTKLRRKILEHANGGIAADRRALNLQQWTEEAIMTWQALSESDDFAKIRSFKYISDHKKLIHGLREFQLVINADEQKFPAAKRKRARASKAAAA